LGKNRGERSAISTRRRTAVRVSFKKEEKKKISIILRRKGDRDNKIENYVPGADKTTALRSPARGKEETSWEGLGEKIDFGVGESDAKDRSKPRVYEEEL